MSADPGRDVVEHVLDVLEPAVPYVVAAPGGFAWWPHACTQRIAAEPPERVAGETCSRVRACHELVRGVDGSAAQFAVLSEWNARHPGLSALRWDGEQGLVSLEAVVDARSNGVEHAARRLASAALLQLGDGLRDGATLAGALGGELAVSAPPGAQPRGDADALCEAWRRFAEAAAQPLELASALPRAAAIDPPPWLRVCVDADGLHAELPCAPPGGAASAGSGAGVATLHVLVAQPHPVLGAGVLCVLRLPESAEPEPARRFSTAALLTEGEVRERTGADALGAWCVHPAAGLAHVAFHPALLVTGDLPETLAWSAGMRARWAMAFLARVAKLRR